MARYGMVIDTRKCVGCMDCVVACKTENNVPEGFCRDWITTTVQGEFPDLRMEIRTERCNHCESPPCVHCCPTGASHVHDRGGVVLVTHAECIGCKACLAACPYDARFIHPDGYASKCTFCIHRVEQGMDPACVSVCPTRCMYFGDRDHGHYLTAPLLSLILLSVGMGALFLDLEYKLHVWRLFLTFQITSPMSWGSWILMAVYPALLGSLFIGLPESMPVLVRRVPVLMKLVGIARRPRVLQGIGIANIGLGIMLGIYTGILLSAMGARPLWNSALLGPLFLFSGLSAGAATLHILTEITGRNDDESDFTDMVMAMMVHWVRPKNEVHDSAHKLTHADNSFLTVELAILGLFLIGMMTSTEVHQRAADLLLTGPYAAVFWVFVIGIGILLPLALQLLQAMNRIKHTVIPAILVVLGGLALRFVIVYAGQASQWMPAMAEQPF